MKINDRSRSISPLTNKADDNRVICRCEEVTKRDVRQAVHSGMFTLQEVRKFLRTGMGLCQGQTCGNLVRTIIAEELGVSPHEIESPVARAPMRPVEMQVLANEGKDV